RGLPGGSHSGPRCSSTTTRRSRDRGKYTSDPTSVITCPSPSEKTSAASADDEEGDRDDHHAADHAERDEEGISHGANYAPDVPHSTSGKRRQFAWPLGPP